MTLSVDVFRVDEDGRAHVQKMPEGGSDVAGAESWRTAVWVFEAVRSLGARFFPLLATGHLVAQPDEVSCLLDECGLQRRNLALITRGTAQGVGPDSLRAIGDRLANVEDACRRALAIGGGVLVW
ncbi:hypothetical protein [Streptomyces sp. NPDC008125]|uniref:hypothetical protein n=1 Tax=Streptomyces sp. NPDC008125 TaxID=3364811 RepID=UPI0036EF9E94